MTVLEAIVVVAMVWVMPEATFIESILVMIQIVVITTVAGVMTPVEEVLEVAGTAVMIVTQIHVIQIE